MGDEPDDAALTQSAPTELGEISDTEANTAWSLSDDLDEKTRGIYISPRVLIAVAVAASLAAVIGASAIVGTTCTTSRQRLGAMSPLRRRVSPHPCQHHPHRHRRPQHQHQHQHPRLPRRSQSANRRRPHVQ